MKIINYEKRRMTRTDKSILAILALAFAVTSIYFASLSSAISPSGANVTQIGTPETAPSVAPQSVAAQAGNVTEINIFGYSSTQSWQGYFGNVTGTIQLADAQSRAIYNWSLASPQGEIYASTNSSIQWVNIQCFNYTAEGTLADDLAQVGNTSLFGYNMSQIETRFNISWDDVDGLNETFALQGPGTHDTFFAANKMFDNGECPSTRVYDSSGSGNNNNFEEVLLYEPQSTSLIFTSLIEDNLLGFDNTAHDFEMLVLENGHGTDTESTPYYFYVELE